MGLFVMEIHLSLAHPSSLSFLILLKSLMAAADFRRMRMKSHVTNMKMMVALDV